MVYMFLCIVQKKREWVINHCFWRSAWWSIKVGLNPPWKTWWINFICVDVAFGQARYASWNRNCGGKCWLWRKRQHGLCFVSTDICTCHGLNSQVSHFLAPIFAVDSFLFAFTTYDYTASTEGADVFIRRGYGDSIPPDKQDKESEDEDAPPPTEVATCVNHLHIIFLRHQHSTEAGATTLPCWTPKNFIKTETDGTGRQSKKRWTGKGESNIRIDEKGICLQTFVSCDACHVCCKYSFTNWFTSGRCRGQNVTVVFGHGSLSRIMLLCSSSNWSPDT